MSYRITGPRNHPNYKSANGQSRSRVRMCRLAVISGAVFLLGIAPVSVLAESCVPETSPPQQPTHTGTLAGQAGQRAVIDPKTRQLDSKAELPDRDLQALADARTKQRQNIIVTQHPDGSKSADLGTAYLTSLEARIVDGKLITCHERRWTRE